MVSPSLVRLARSMVRLLRAMPWLLPVTDLQPIASDVSLLTGEPHGHCTMHTHTRHLIAGTSLPPNGLRAVVSFARAQLSSCDLHQFLVCLQHHQALPLATVSRQPDAARCH